MMQHFISNVSVARECENLALELRIRYFVLLKSLSGIFIGSHCIFERNGAEGLTHYQYKIRNCFCRTYNTYIFCNLDKGYALS